MRRRGSDGAEALDGIQKIQSWNLLKNIQLKLIVLVLHV